MTTINIRKIQKKDNPVIKNLVINTLKEFGAKGPGFASSDAELEDMYTAYQAKNHCFYVVELDGEVLGCGGIAPLAGENKENTAELRKMYFDKKLRGKGAGKQLIDKCIEKAVQFNFESIYLETIPSMKIAQKLYKSRGFEYLPQAKGSTCHTACDVHMLKKLS